MDETTLKLRATAGGLDSLLRQLFGEACPFTLLVYADGHLHVLGNLEVEEAFQLLEDAAELHAKTAELMHPASSIIQ